MIKLNTYNQKAEKTGDISVSNAVFGVEVNESLVHQAMVAQMSNERQVLAHTKDRSEVRGGGKKPWKQKGTGRARAGSNRSPIWIGGGVTFGPLKTRNFSKKINKKMKQKALMMTLSDKVSNESLIVLDDLKMDEYKTKIFNGIIANIEKSILKIEKTKADAKEVKKEDAKAKKETKTKRVKVKKYKRSILVVNDVKDDKTKKSGRNLAGVEMINLDNINIVDLLKYKNIVITKEAVKKLEERYKKEK